MELKEYLDGFFKASEKLLILGAGSELMSDDACGPVIINRLAEKTEHTDKLKIINGSTAPENFSGEIIGFNPGGIIIIDAADLNEKPGSIMTIDPDVVSGVGFSTHMLPLKVLVDYIKKEINCKITIIGIQPENALFGFVISPSVNEAIDEIITILTNLVNKYFKA